MWYFKVLLILLASNAKGEEEEYKLRLLDELVNVNLGWTQDFGTCFQAANATNTVGCQTSYSGEEGVIIVINNEDDVKRLLSNPNNLMRVVPAFTSQYLANLTRGEKLLDILDVENVVGMLFLYDRRLSMLKQSFSGEKTCPLYSQLGGKKSDKCHEWNPTGSGLWRIMTKKPYAVVTHPHELNLINKCFNKLNKPEGKWMIYPLCAVRMTVVTEQVGNSEMCIRRSKPNVVYKYFAERFNSAEFETCDIYGADSGSLMINIPPTVKLNTTNIKALLYHDKSVMLVTTRLDSVTLIRNINAGASTVLTGLLSMLLVVHALGNDKDKYSELINKATVTGRHVVFAGLTNEGLEFSGTIRMIYEMEKGQLPKEAQKNIHLGPDALRMRHIGIVMDMQQMAQANGQYYAHYIKQDKRAEKLIKAVANLSSASSLEGVNHILPSHLPPSNVQVFLKHKNISGIVLSNYRSQLNNRVLHSFMDDIHQLENDEDVIKSMIGGAEVALKLVTQWLTKHHSYNFNMDISETTATYLFHCVVKSNYKACKLLGITVRGGHAGQYLHTIMPQMTVDLKTKLNPPPTFAFAKEILQVFSATKKIASTPTLNCKDLRKNITKHKTHHSYFRVYYDVCYLSIVYTFSSISPAFIIKDYDFQSNKYPAWSEGRFKISKVQLHLIRSSTTDIFIFLGAIGWLVVCVAFVACDRKFDSLNFNFSTINCNWLKSKSDSLENSSDDSSDEA